MADSLDSTYWESEYGTEVTNVTVSFNSTISVSKVFIHFRPLVPSAATLQFLNGEMTWQPLQYFADDCGKRFGMANNSK